MTESAKYPRHPACWLTPGTRACLDAALPFCERCPWWTRVAVPDDELDAELKLALWPVGHELMPEGAETWSPSADAKRLIDAAGEYDPSEDADSELVAGSAADDGGTVTPTHGSSPGTDEQRDIELVKRLTGATDEQIRRIRGDASNDALGGE